MKKKKTIITIAMLCGAIMVLLFVCFTSAYLIDKETADNVITIGEVKVAIDEGDFDSSKTYSAVAGTILPKSPKVQNTGINDEYVFLTVSVPKEEVTFLNETGSNTGKKDGTKRTAEIFKLLTDTNGTPISGGDVDVVFYYHAGTTTVEGWKYLGFSTSNSNNVYSFGYNKKLKPGQESVTIFDKIQLKSFIDEELNNTTESVYVRAYGIQSDKLNISGVADTYDGILTDQNIQDIYKILINKQVM